MKIVASAGVPIFIVGVGNLFFKKYGDNLPPELRLEFLQAQTGSTPSQSSAAEPISR